MQVKKNFLNIIKNVISSNNWMLLIIKIVHLISKNFEKLVQINLKALSFINEFLKILYKY